MLDITIIILTYNEKLHLRRCLERLEGVGKRIVVVDCFSKDGTQDIAREMGAEVVEHEWPGNQAEQFNWALDNIKIDTEWVLRLDADEYMLPELVEELKNKVPALPQDVTGIEFKRRHIFMDKWVKYGIYPVIMMRMFRNGMGRYDARLMDEHIALKEGRSIVFENDFCDHSLINISEYCRKHINYAEREACEVLDELYGLSSHIDTSLTLGEQAQEKHKKKGTYNKLPLFWRSFAYFCFRYFLKGAFLDGKEGFLFAFIQGWWYRTLVDAKVLECKKACGNDREAMKVYIAEHWGIKL